MLKAKSEIPAKDIDAWTKRLETEWTCAQFASGLQVTPHLALEILRKNKEVRREDDLRCKTSCPYFQNTKLLLVGYYYLLLFLCVWRGGWGLTLLVLLWPF